MMNLVTFHCCTRSSLNSNRQSGIKAPAFVKFFAAHSQLIIEHFSHSDLTYNRHPLHPVYNATRCSVDYNEWFEHLAHLDPTSAWSHANLNNIGSLRVDVRHFSLSKIIFPVLENGAINLSQCCVTFFAFHPAGK